MKSQLFSNDFMKVYAIGIFSNQPLTMPLVWVDDFPTWASSNQVRTEIIQLIALSRDDLNQGRTQDGFKFFIHTFYEGFAVAITDVSFTDLSGQVLTEMIAAKYIGELLVPTELATSWTVFLKARPADYQYDRREPIDRIKSELAQVRQIITQQVELLFQRQGKVEFLLEQTEQLVNESTLLLPKPTLIQTNRSCCNLL